jgi:hypothetical protein
LGGVWKKILTYSNGGITMSEVKQITTKNSGIIPGLIACVLAILGIFTIGIVFIPLAAFVALIGTIVAIKNINLGGIGIAVLAWILTIFGFASSPVLLGAIGLGIAAK